VTDFTPLASSIGGVLIGASAVLLMAASGRIAGIIGILGGVATGTRDGAFLDRAAFVAGLLAAPLLYTLALHEPVRQTVSSNLPLMVMSGLLVGIGTAVGGGCTSGHGVCGLARFSVRSLAAVLTFMAAGAATVFVVRHVLGG